MDKTQKPELKIDTSYLPKTDGFSSSQLHTSNTDTNEVRFSPRSLNVCVNEKDLDAHPNLLIGSNTPKPSSKHSFEKEKDNFNKALESLEEVIFSCNSKIEEINKIQGYTQLKPLLLLEFTQKLDFTKTHILIINQHFDKITEIENISESDQDTLFNVLNIAGVVGNEQEKSWLLTHNWKGLLSDSNIKELIEDITNDRDQKERVGSLIISKY